MKNRLFAFVFILVLTGTMSSCFVSRDAQGRHTDRGARFPHDEHPEEKH
ncbi:hypothetical protein [Mucilaginibacter sp. KACC 22063]|nr:hypothetical protein [Mucilaginibacter sp. KACC 22063]WDF56063.1 hypothetical protein PQ461_03180 [Mucilaginibacter sp. KACC 22063]